ncbi:MAG: histidine kinase dimerization/phospho-acceptor domain-containing protein [Nocardioides sp.]
MRKRLTLAFVLVTLFLLGAAGVVRAVTLDGLLREREGEHVFHQATAVAAVVDQQDRSGQPIDRDFLSDFLASDTQVEFAPDKGQPVVVDGPDFRADDDAISSTVVLDAGVLTIRQSGEVIQSLVRADMSAALVLLGVVAVAAAVLGYLISWSLSAPFQRLAVAASALGRGRFDLDLPPTRVPEARAISEALGSSAVALRERLEREQQFAMHASHVLRTPLTGLRLQLEEMTLDTSLPAESHAAAIRCMTAVDEVNEVAGDLVDLSRRGLIGGAQIPLRDLATSSAQHWADELEEHDRGLTAAVEGDIDLTFTPGPIEQILDLLLRDTIRHGTGDARLIFEGDARGHLRMTVRGHRETPSEGADLVGEARAVVEALGGRLQSVAGPDGTTDLVALLPRR